MEGYVTNFYDILLMIKIFFTEPEKVTDLKSLSENPSILTLDKIILSFFKVNDLLDGNIFVSIVGFKLLGNCLPPIDRKNYLDILNMYHNSDYYTQLINFSQLKQNICCTLLSSLIRTLGGTCSSSRFH